MTARAASRGAPWALVAALAVVLAPVRSPAETRGVEIHDNEFVPAEIEVTAGDTVRWTHAGDNPHSVTATDGSFDSSPMCPPLCLSRGDDFSHRFDQPGSVAYYCRLHGAPDGTGMAGAVVVRAAGGAAGGTAAKSPKNEANKTPEPRVEGAKLARTGPEAGLALAGAALALLGVGMRGHALTRPGSSSRRRHARRGAVPPPG